MRLIARNADQCISNSMIDRVCGVGLGWGGRREWMGVGRWETARTLVGTSGR